jgi:hypothetical protein
MKKTLHNDIKTLRQMVAKACRTHAATLKSNDGGWRDDYLLLAEAILNGDFDLVDKR